MGGFISSAGFPIATTQQLGSVNEKEIEGKSKGDALSKGVALLQGVWFTVQCLARAHQRLAVMQLEVTTLAFAIANVFIWLLWWDKPLDVQCAIVLGTPSESAVPRAMIPVQFPRSRQPFWEALFGFNRSDHPSLPYISILLFWSLPQSDDDEIKGFGITTLVSAVFGAVHRAAWHATFPTAVEMWLWRSSSSVIATIPSLVSLIFLMAMARKSFYDTKLGSMAAKIFSHDVVARHMLIVLSTILASRPLDYVYSAYLEKFNLATA
ncbi:hypothetical protein MSAN_00622100 [Mycena sanguinolenta]|uniref:Uncharacterized protein n=1 Tax=Mycena sanguinolenta TaxID=230812 RepID=A0A8H7DFW2_9AGAR|nr:hypothetical protein MSAN_00622100 [Mycena sanguinolenta]